MQENSQLSVLVIDPNPGMRSNLQNMLNLAGINVAANEANGPRISAAGSRVSAWSIPTNEELMIARHTRRLLVAA